MDSDPSGRIPRAITDRERIAALLANAVDPDQLRVAHALAARKLLQPDGAIYPADGCAITLSVLMQAAGLDVPDLFWAIDVPAVLLARGWVEVPVGCQRGGDVGSTCGVSPCHGDDHLYLVIRAVNQDEMVVVDNQAAYPHFRWSSGRGGQTPTTMFYRAPDPEAPPMAPPAPTPARQ